MERKSAWRAVPGMLLAALAGAPVAGQAGEPVTPDLTPKLDRLLRREMQAIDEAMRAIFSAIARGDHATVADKADGIRASFILKQNLTPADRQDLKAAVPQAFVQLDRAFHQDAAALAEAAGERDVERELELFQQMSRRCVACHSRFVSDRFPGLR